MGQPPPGGSDLDGSPRRGRRASRQYFPCLPHALQSGRRSEKVRKRTNRRWGLLQKTAVKKGQHVVIAHRIKTTPRIRTHVMSKCSAEINGWCTHVYPQQSYVWSHI